MKKLLEYVFITNEENKWIFGVLGFFICLGLYFVHKDTTPYTNGWKENGIWIYWSIGIAVLWFGLNVGKYFKDKE